MADDPMTEPPQRVAFLLVPNFSMMALSAVLEPFRAANWVARRTLYDWRLLSVDGEPVTASNSGVLMAQGAIGPEDSFTMVVVVAGLDPQEGRDERILAWLRRMARRGSRIGAVSTGTYHLAWAGLLDGYRCTIHWENLSAFTETFPRLDVTGRLFEIDRDRFTSAGGTASLDMTHYLIGQAHGIDLANQVAEQFLHARPRQGHAPQRMELRERLGVSHPKLLAAIAEIEANLAEPLPRAALARAAGLSTRQLERLFRIYLNCTPSQYYLEARLKHAQILLAQTSMPILEVAVACGFASASHFAKCYRSLFSHSPRAERAPRPVAPTQVMGLRRAW
ncbi:GlxA family transcriptional regulator [Inquilinus limosus]|uniref:AraC family transcriptional regulator n=1 Tax=Inquilinus limosus MP06 TaxID=1398085 RepID=A0A0A0D4K6_9PROT|nr:GlxA family transcriptional regulator [Inquilinus limosus]KGM33641.1 AraC family transcriptional regulator [Inquilinus limosus MP06]